jgi:hypothetical protein
MPASRSRATSRRDLAPVHGLVQSRQRLGAQERRRKKLVLGRTSIPSLANRRTTPINVRQLVLVAVAAAVTPTSVPAAAR